MEATFHSAERLAELRRLSRERKARRQGTVDDYVRSIVAAHMNRTFSAGGANPFDQVVAEFLKVAGPPASNTDTKSQQAAGNGEDREE